MDGIVSSEVLLLVVTAHALASEWVRLEIAAAMKYQKRIIPLWLETPDDKTYQELYLEPLQYRDFRGLFTTVLDTLLSDLPKPKAGLPGYCQQLMARLAEAP